MEAFKYRKARIQRVNTQFTTDKAETNSSKLRTSLQTFIDNTGIRVDNSSAMSWKMLLKESRFGAAPVERRDLQANKSQDRSKMVKSELDTLSIGMKSFDVGLVPSLKSRAVKKEILRLQSLNMEDPYD
jgi:hypothetical protein